MFLKNKNIIFKIRRSKVTDYAALKEAAQAHLSLHLSKCHTVGNHMLCLIYIYDQQIQLL